MQPKSEQTHTFCLMFWNKINKQVQISFAPNISSQYMIPLIWINRYSCKVFSHITHGKVLFLFIKWQYIWLRWQQISSLSITSKWRNWAVSKRQKANKNKLLQSLQKPVLICQQKQMACSTDLMKTMVKRNQKTP